MPATADWNSSANWMPATVPNGATDTATFAASSQASVSLSQNTAVATIVFDATAGTFILNAPANTALTLGGTGITNNSGNAEIFFATTNGMATGGSIIFANSATAGALTNLFTDGGAVTGNPGGQIMFLNSASAGSAAISNNGGTVSGANGGITSFSNNATAGSGAFTIYGGIANGSFGGEVDFHDSATAAGATFTNEPASASSAAGGTTTFFDASTAGSSTLIADGSATHPGGAIVFRDNSTGGTARVEVFTNGSLAIDAHATPSVAIGSIEGSGNVFTGANNLSVGGNNLSTSFSGFVNDNALGGGLTKTGSGVLTFENRAGNNFLSDTLTLSIASASTINLNFSGTPDTIRSLIINGVPQTPGLYGSAASGAPNVLPQFTGTGKVLVTTFAVSRKLQGANSFDINLPLAGAGGVECRSGGGSNNYQIVVNFVGNVSFNSVSLSSGTGSVSGTTGNNTSTLTIDLTGIISPQKIVVTVAGLNDGSSTSDLAIPMRVLVGDTSGNGSVNASDVSQTKGQAGQVVTASNFREDVATNGTINASDVSLVKARSGQSVP